MPNPNYGFMSRNLVNKILINPPGRLCLGLDPATGGALQILRNTDKISLWDEALFVHAYNKLSNGKNADNTKGESFKRFNRENQTCETMYYDHVPIKTVSVINGAYNEYAKIKAMPDFAALPPIDLVNYFVANYSYIWKMKARGLPIKHHLKNWQDAFNQQKPDIRNDVQSKLGSITFAREAFIRYLGGKARKFLGIAKIEALLKRRKKPKWPFKNALEYIIWADNEDAKRPASHSAHESRIQGIAASTIPS